MSSIVLLRGLTREARHWGGFIEQLQQQMPAARIVAMDLPGTGLRNSRRSPCEAGAIATDCRAQLAQRGLAPPYLVVALSLGAIVSLAWMQRHPADVTGAVLINTSLRPFSPFYRRLRPRNYLRLLRGALLGRDPVRREKLILALTSRFAPDRPALLQQWIGIARDRPVTRSTALCQLWAALRFRAPPAPPCQPLLLLAGARDALVDPHCSRQLAQAWGSTLELHEAAGHDLPLDDGPWVAARISAWIHAEPKLQQFPATPLTPGARP